MTQPTVTAEELRQWSRTVALDEEAHIGYDRVEMCRNAIVEVVKTLNEAQVRVGAIGAWGDLTREAPADVRIAAVHLHDEACMKFRSYLAVEATPSLRIGLAPANSTKRAAVEGAKQRGWRCDWKEAVRRFQ